MNTVRLAAILTVVSAASAQTLYYTQLTTIHAQEIKAGPDGALWFTDGAGQIGRITPGGAVTEFPLPSTGNSPWGITAGPDGALWFTELGGKIGRITTSGAITEYTPPSPAGQSITAGPDGALWATSSNNILRITTTGSISQFPIPTTSSDPVGIAAGPDGALWFTEFFANKIARMSVSGVITEFPLPTPDARPQYVVAGPDGALWFTESGPAGAGTNGAIGRITTGGKITEYLLPTNSHPSAITVGPDGALWFTGFLDLNLLGRITTSGAVSTYNAPGVYANGLCTGPDGAIWYAAASELVRAALNFPTTGSVTVATTPAGLTITADGTSYVAPHSFNWAPGETHTIGFASPQSAGTGSRYVFSNWSDGGALSHTVTVGSAAATYTAATQTQYLLNLSVAPAGAGTIAVSPPSADNYYSANTTVTMTANANTGYRFSNWSGDVTTGNNPQTAFMGAPHPIQGNFISASETVSFTHFGGASSLVAGPDGALWSGGTITRITTDGTFTNLGIGDFITPTFPFMGPDGALWDYGHGTNTASPSFVGRLAVNGRTASNYVLPVGSGAAIAGPDGAIWFVGPPGKIGRITLAGAMTLFPLASSSVGVGGMVAGPDGALWFTETNGNIGRITTSGTLSEFIPPTPGNGAAGITVGPDGALWFAESQVDKIGRITTAGNISEYPILTAGGLPISIANGPDGALWFTEEHANILGRISTAGVVTEHPIPPPGALPTSIILGPDGALWFTASTSLIRAMPIGATPPIPQTVSAAPASGSGPQQTITFQFSDLVGYQNLGVVDILINSALDGRSACYLAYVVASGSLVLVNDAGKAEGPYAGSLTLGGSGTIQNSQCVVGLTSAVGAGTTLTLTLNVTFLPAFGGNKIFYVAARDLAAGSSGWQALGTWQVPFTPTGTISLGAASPARVATPSGTPVSLSVSISDSLGTSDLGVINILINDSIDGRHACYLAYSAPAGMLYLVDDGGDAGGPFSGATPLNGGGTIANGQCSVNGAGALVTTSGNNTLTLTLPVSFSPSFTGNRIVYAAARDHLDGNNTGWQALATATVQ